MSKAIVEKDLWVTSLSKVYKLIERFSEDIDLALDYENKSNQNFF